MDKIRNSTNEINTSINMSEPHCLCKNSSQIEQNADKQKQVARRPPPLNFLPKKLHNPNYTETPDNMIEWHGILLFNEDVQSPISPTHWSIRITQPLLEYQYRLVINLLSMMRVANTNWKDMKPVEFLPNIYLGSYYDTYEFKHSVRISILEDFSLIDMIPDDSEPITKLKIHANDDSNTNIMEHFDKIRDFLDSQPDESIKLIHCVAGMNRSATLATAYYMYKTKQPLAVALQYMVALRPIILRNENFVMQLVVWAYDNGLV